MIAHTLMATQRTKFGHLFHRPNAVLVVDSEYRALSAHKLTKLWLHLLRQCNGSEAKDRYAEAIFQERPHEEITGFLAICKPARLRTRRISAHSRSCSRKIGINSKRAKLIVTSKLGR
jgi:hypothetical protein